MCGLSCARSSDCVDVISNGWASGSSAAVDAGCGASMATSCDTAIPRDSPAGPFAARPNSMTGSMSGTSTRDSRTTLISGRCTGAERELDRSARKSERRSPRDSVKSSDAATAAGRVPLERHHSMPHSTATKVTPTTRSMTRSSGMRSGRWSGRGHAYRLVDVDGHETRAAGLGHGDAEELRGELHGGLVVRDEDELHALRHLLDDVAEAADVVLVERRIHFVQQAERRRVQVEDGEHQRHRRERFLAARQLVDAAVALARRARHDGHAGRQRVLAHQLEIDVAAAEQLGKLVLQARIDAVERVFEAGARFLVDL